MLVAARSSHDLAFCTRAIASARSKYTSALAASGSGIIRVISPAVLWISASDQHSPVVSAAFIASPIQFQASSNFPSTAYALATSDKLPGKKNVDPDD